MKRRPYRPSILVVVVLVSFVLVGCDRMKRESGRVASISAICTASISFYQINLEYPSKLEQLGEAGLIDSALASGRKSGYVFTYIAGNRDANGKIASYTVLARPQEFGRTGRRSYFLDDTCKVRFTEENRDATKSDPVLN